MIQKEKLSTYDKNRCMEYAAKWHNQFEGIENKAYVSKRPRTVEDVIASKAAECVVARLLGAKPSLDVIPPGGTDGGIDFTSENFTCGPVSFDVKNSVHPQADKLIWPLTSGHSIKAIPADILVLATSLPADHSDFGWFNIWGFVTSKQFRYLAHVAGDQVNLKKNTRFMYGNELADINYLRK